MSSVPDLATIKFLRWATLSTSSVMARSCWQNHSTFWKKSQKLLQVKSAIFDRLEGNHKKQGALPQWWGGDQTVISGLEKVECIYSHMETGTQPVCRHVRRPFSILNMLRMEKWSQQSFTQKIRHYQS